MAYGDLTGRNAGRGYTTNTTTSRRRLPALGPRHFTAQYPGTCPKCSSKIRVGDKITRYQGKGYLHTRCL